METATIAREVREFIEENFLFGQADGLAGEVSFLDAGVIDSTGILELIAFLQQRYGVQIEDDEAVPENLDSIDRVAAYVNRKLNQGGRS